MLVKTSNLSGQALGWAVAIALGYTDVQITGYGDGEEECFFRPGKSSPDGKKIYGSGERWKPQSDWAQGGPIIEHENITIGTNPNVTTWIAYINQGMGRHRNEHSVYGSTPLMAAMRCLVASKLGDEVEIPDELAL